jgi:hypothetical protein
MSVERRENMSADEALEFVERMLNVRSIMYFEVQVDGPLDAARLIQRLMHLDCTVDASLSDGLFRIRRPLTPESSKANA